MLLLILLFTIFSGFEDCEKGKTSDKYQSKRSNETSEVSLLSSLNGEKDVQSLWDRQTGEAVLPPSNSRQKTSSINWNSRLDRRQLKLRKNSSHTQQSRISDYFEFVNKLDTEIFLRKENEFLRSKIEEMEKNSPLLIKKIL
jgi:hypothetical protein